MDLLLREEHFQVRETARKFADEVVAPRARELDEKEEFPTDIVRQKVAAGKSLEQVKSEGLPEEWKSWGTGFIKTEIWLEIVYRSLTAKK